MTTDIGLRTSQLPPAPALTLSDLLPLVQAGASVQGSVQQLLTLILSQNLTPTTGSRVLGTTANPWAELVSQRITLDNGVFVDSGNGNPNGVVTGNRGCVWLQADVANGLWFKTTNASNTGWLQVFITSTGTPLAITDGGTGATTAPAARASLGVNAQATRETQSRPTLILDAADGIFQKNNRSAIVRSLDLTSSSFASLTRATAKFDNDRSGVLREFASGVPSFSFPFANAGFKGGIGIHRAATNLVQWSEDLSNAWWTKDGVTIASTTMAGSPRATATVNTIQASAGAGLHRVVSSAMAGLTSTDNQGFSTWLGAGTATRARLKMVNSSAVVIGQVDIDLATRTVSGVDALNAVVEDPVGAAGLSRIRLYPSAAIGTTSATVEILILDASGNESFTAVGTETILAWGQQFERWRPSPYLPSAGSSGARNADVLTLALTEEWYGTPWGASAYCEFQLHHFNGATAAEYRRYLFMLQFSTTDYLGAYVLGNQVTLQTRNNNDTATLTAVPAFTLTAGENVRLAVSTNGSTVNVGINGISHTFARTLRPAVWTQLALGANESGARQLNGALSNFRVEPIPWTLAQVENYTR